jgi:hypothetical protein
MPKEKWNRLGLIYKDGLKKRKTQSPARTQVWGGFIPRLGKSPRVHFPGRPQKLPALRKMPRPESAIASVAGPVAFLFPDQIP